MPRNTSCTDHTGREFRTMKEMLAHWNITWSAYRARSNRHWTLEKILTTPVSSTAVKDHLEKEYESNKAMASAYGLGSSTLRNRLQSGWTLERALTTPPSDGSVPVEDHLGNKYPSVKAMAKAYGVSATALRDNLFKKHLPPKQAIFGEHCVEDHTGAVFRTEHAMCAHWGVEQMTYRRRIASGMTQKEALEAGPGDAPNAIECTDHLGKTYPSRQAMCTAYGITPATYLSRIEAGWTKQDALTVPNGVMRACTDWSGRQYASIKEMCGTLRLKKHDLSGRDDTATAAAEACAKRWPGMPAGKYLVRECVAFPWFLCEDLEDRAEIPHSGELMLHANQILGIMRGAA